MNCVLNPYYLTGISPTKNFSIIEVELPNVLEGDLLYFAAFYLPDISYHQRYPFLNLRFLNQFALSELRYAYKILYAMVL